MKPQHELEKDILHGDHSQQLLEDPLLRKAIDGMRETVYHNIRTSHYSKIDEREDLYKMLRTIDAFEDEFKRRIQGGKKAKSLLKQLLKR